MREITEKSVLSGAQKLYRQSESRDPDREISIYNGNSLIGKYGGTSNQSDTNNSTTIPFDSTLKVTVNDYFSRISSTVYAYIRNSNDDNLSSCSGKNSTSHKVIDESGMKVHITYTGGCVTGDSLILMADGTYKQAKDVKLGDM